MKGRFVCAAMLCLALAGCGDHRTPYVATQTAVAVDARNEAEKIAERKYDHCLTTHSGNTTGVSFRGDVVITSYEYKSYDRC